MLLPQLPAMTKFYGLTPADIDAMTSREISEYQVFMDKVLAEQEKS